MLKRCPDCKGKNIELSNDSKEIICRDCGSIFRKDLTLKEYNKYKEKLKSMPGVLTHSGGIYCPLCGKKTIYHGTFDVTCITCNKRIRKLYKGKKQKEKLKQLDKMIDKVENFKSEFFDLFHMKYKKPKKKKFKFLFRK